MAEVPRISRVTSPSPDAIRPVKGWRRYWALVKQAVSDFSSDDAFRLSAAVSYYTVFSLGPLLVLSIGIASLIFGEEAARGQLSSQISGLIGADGAKAVEAMLASSAKPSSGILASIIGFIVLLFGATGVFTELKSSLNHIWKAEGKVSPGWRGLIKDRLLSFAMVLVIGFLLLVSLVVSAVVAGVGEYFSALIPNTLWLGTASFAVSFLLVTLLFALIYKILPDVELEWRDVAAGAVFTSVLFTIGKTLIGIYLGKSAIASAYGASASLVLVMLWAYYSSLILFLGAELTKVYANAAGSKQGAPGAVPPAAGVTK